MFNFTVFDSGLPSSSRKFFKVDLGDGTWIEYMNDFRIESSSFTYIHEIGVSMIKHTKAGVHCYELEDDDLESQPVIVGQP